MQAARLTTADAGNVLEYIINYFIPSAQPLLQRYPRVFRLLGILLALWYWAPLASIQASWSRFARFCVSTIEVSSGEDLFNHLTTWVSQRRTLQPDKLFHATIDKSVQVSRRRRGDLESGESPLETPEDQVQYEHSRGLQIFVHDKRVFFASRTLLEGDVRRPEKLSVSCFGRSTSPIQRLIEHAYRIGKKKEKSTTIIRRPYAAAIGRGFKWSRLTSKLPRSLDTVILDAEQKAAVVKDIAEYMDESTRTFYADHGIPYRRGYMFYGPPGTGKTSFCLALAAQFRLEVYVLTLLDHNLQDSDLMSLMIQLPTPCILLLEDVDTAGLTRTKQFAEITCATENETEAKQSVAAAGPGNTTERAAKPNEEDQNRMTTRISLSGLLNAIDGVAAPEGHILIMTTNKPYELDDALARAGRVSVKVAFANATKTQAEELFLRMYLSTPSSGEEVQTKGVQDDSTVRRLAWEFAENIPEGQFSPADLQDYLLIHKRDSQLAVSMLSRWVDDKRAEQRRANQAREAR